jgi:hypothetical protein
MRKVHLLRLAAYLSWAATLISLWYFLRAWFAPDACLDFGGSFNYVKWECSSEVNQFIDIWAYELPSFWILVSCVVLAIFLHISTKRAVARQAVQVGCA